MVKVRVLTTNNSSAHASSRECARVFRINLIRSAASWRVHDHTQTTNSDVALTVYHLTPSVQEHSPVGYVISKSDLGAGIPQASHVVRAVVAISPIEVVDLIGDTPSSAVSTVHPILAVVDFNGLHACICITAFSNKPIGVGRVEVEVED